MFHAGSRSSTPWTSAYVLVSGTSALFLSIRLYLRERRVICSTSVLQNRHVSMIQVKGMRAVAAGNGEKIYLLNSQPSTVGSPTQPATCRSLHCLHSNPKTMVSSVHRLTRAIDTQAWLGSGFSHIHGLFIGRTECSVWAHCAAEGLCTSHCPSAGPPSPAHSVLGPESPWCASARCVELPCPRTRQCEHDPRLRYTRHTSDYANPCKYSLEFKWRVLTLFISGLDMRSGLLRTRSNS